MNRKASILLSLGISIALIAAGIRFLWHHQNSFGHGDGGWVMPYHMMMGGGGMGLVMIIFWVAVLAAVGLVISGMISNHRSSESSDNKEFTNAEQILKQRSAHGKIEDSRHAAMKRNLP